jgi:transposase
MVTKKSEETFSTLLKAKHVALTGFATAKIRQVMQEMEVSEATVYNWINGKTTPKKTQREKLQKIYEIQQPAEAVTDEK